MSHAWRIVGVFALAAAVVVPPLFLAHPRHLPASATPAAMNDAADVMATRLGVPRPQVFLVPEAMNAYAYCVFHECKVFMGTRVPQNDVVALLAHELGHVRQGHEATWFDHLKWYGQHSLLHTSIIGGILLAVSFVGWPWLIGAAAWVAFGEWRLPYSTTETMSMNILWNVLVATAVPVVFLAIMSGFRMLGRPHLRSTAKAWLGVTAAIAVATGVWHGLRHLEAQGDPQRYERDANRIGACLTSAAAFNEYLRPRVGDFYHPPVTTEIAAIQALTPEVCAARLAQPLKS